MDLSPTDRKADDYFFTNASIDWNIYASRDSIDSVKPRAYYFSNKEAYLAKNSNLSPIRVKEIPIEEEWKATKEDAKKWKVDLKPI